MRRFAWVLVWACLPCLTARAEDPPSPFAEPAPDESGRDPAQDPAPQGPVVIQPGQTQPQNQPSPGQAQPGPPQQTQAQSGQAREAGGRGILYGGHVLVPIWLTQPANTADIRAAVAARFRFGWEFPYGLSAELGVGYHYAGFRDSSDSLNGYFFQGGGRFSFLNPSALVPFVGVGAQINVWNGCGPCRAPADNNVTVGVQVPVGLIYEITAHIGIELGVETAVLFHTAGFFDGAQVTLSPFVGATLYL